MFKKEGSFSRTKGKKAKDTPLKKSDRRKLRDAFVSILQTNDETSSTSDSNNLKKQIDHIFLDSKSNVSIRKLKLKHTNSNAGATNIYSRSPSSTDEEALLWPYTKFTQVLLMEVDKVTLPSLALLSILPGELLNILPTVVVPPIVSKYLCRGADVMRSGIISMPATHAHAGWCVIRALGNQQPFAVGFVTNGTDPSTIGADTKGVGVQIVTCYGDEIYQSQRDPTAKAIDHGGAPASEIGGGIFDNGNYGNVGFIDGSRVYGLVSSEGEGNDDSEEENEDNAIENAMEEATISAGGGDDANDDVDHGTSNSEIEKNATDNAEISDDEVDEVDDMETILLEAFHDAVVRMKKDQLPLRTLTFYSQHILPARREGSFIDLKATSYKKLGTFLKAVEAKGIIKLGAANGDPVAFINAVDRNHVDLREAKIRKKTEADGKPKTDDQNGKKKLALANLFIIPNKIVTLMHLNEDDVKATYAKSEDRRGTGYLTAPECRHILDQYFVDNNLIDKFDPEHIKVDGPLCDAVLRKTKKELQNTAFGKNEYQESVTRKELNIKWLEKMDKAYAVVAIPGSIIMSMKRGLPPKISFVVEARQSRKKFITRVRGVEEVSHSARNRILFELHLYIPSRAHSFFFKSLVWNKSE
jgi:translation initiation factor 2D